MASCAYAIGMCRECGGVKDSADCFPDCNTCYNKKKAEQRSKYANRKCVRCYVNINTGYHWCYKCFNEWEHNKSECLIEDD